MEKIKKVFNSKIMIIVSLIIMFILIFIVNSNTIWVADDYAFYNKVWTGQDTFSLSRVFEQAENFYTTWTGRYVSTVINYVLLYFPKIIFNILNSLVFIGLIFCIYKIVKKEKENRPDFLWIIFAMIWLFVPRTGETMFWQIGSVIYMWTFFGIVLFSMPYCNLIKNKTNKKHNIILSILMLVSGVIVGNGFETNSLMFIVFLTLALMVVFIRDKKLPLWSILGYISIIIGFATNFFSPGNSVRMESMKSAESFIDMILFGTGRLFYRGIVETKIYILLAVLIIAYYIYIFRNKPKNILLKRMIVINIMLLVILATIICTGIYCSTIDLTTYLQWFYSNYLLLNGILAIILALVVGIIIYAFFDRKKVFDKTEKTTNQMVGVFAVSAAVGISSYVVTSLAWPRSYMGMSIFLIIAILYIVHRINIKRYVKYTLCIILAILLMGSYINALIEMNQSYKWYKSVDEDIRNKISNNETYIVVENQMFENSHNAASTEKWVIPAQLENEEYVTADKIHKDYEWINMEVTKYYFENNNAWSEGKRILSK